MGECKILWGYDLGAAKPADPNNAVKKASKFEEHDIKMKFPNRSGKKFIDFLESIKATKTSKETLEKSLGGISRQYR